MADNKEIEKEIEKIKAMLNAFFEFDLISKVESYAREKLFWINNLLKLKELVETYRNTKDETKELETAESISKMLLEIRKIENLNFSVKDLNSNKSVFDNIDFGKKLNDWSKEINLLINKWLTEANFENQIKFIFDDNFFSYDSEIQKIKVDFWEYVNLKPELIKNINIELNKSGDPDFYKSIEEYKEVYGDENKFISQISIFDDNKKKFLDADENLNKFNADNIKIRIKKAEEFKTWLETILRLDLKLGEETLAYIRSKRDLVSQMLELNELLLSFHGPNGVIERQNKEDNILVLLDKIKSKNPNLGLNLSEENLDSVKNIFIAFDIDKACKQWFDYIVSRSNQKINESQDIDVYIKLLEYKNKYGHENKIIEALEISDENKKKFDFETNKKKYKKHLGLGITLTSLGGILCVPAVPLALGLVCLFILLFLILLVEEFGIVPPAIFLYPLPYIYDTACYCLGLFEFTFTSMILFGVAVPLIGGILIAFGSWEINKSCGLEMKKVASFRDQCQKLEIKTRDEANKFLEEYVLNKSIKEININGVEDKNKFNKAFYLVDDKKRTLVIKKLIDEKKLDLFDRENISWMENKLKELDKKYNNKPKKGCIIWFWIAFASFFIFPPLMPAIISGISANPPVVILIFSAFAPTVFSVIMACLENKKKEEQFTSNKFKFVCDELTAQKNKTKDNIESKDEIKNINSSDDKTQPLNNKLSQDKNKDNNKANKKTGVFGKLEKNKDDGLNKLC